MNHLILLLLLLFSIACQGQDLDSLKNTLKPKKFIDRIEIFAGPNLSFNYGNKFIENYEDRYVTNKRLLKPGLVLGMGFSHPVKKRFLIVFRGQFEKKGTKNELNRPLNPVNDDSRVIENFEYSYNYLTVVITPEILLGSKNHISLKFGGYYSFMQDYSGYGKTHIIRDNHISEGHFKARLYQFFDFENHTSGFTWAPQYRGIDRSDFGLTFRIGYRIFRNDFYNLHFELFHQFGLTNINKDITYGHEERNRTIGFIIVYAINSIHFNKKY